jgi:hypothetical protein
MTRKNSLNKGTIWKEVGFILVVIEKTEKGNLICASNE